MTLLLRKASRLIACSTIAPTLTRRSSAPLQRQSAPIMTKAPDAYVILWVESLGSGEAEEVVELCAHVVKARFLELEEDEFHQYVRPADPDLLPHTKAYAVANAKPFQEVAKELDAWLKEEMGVKPEEDKVMVVAEDSKAFGRRVKAQCAKLGIGLPWWGKSWVNLRAEYRDVYGVSEPLERITFESMVKGSGLKWEGKRDCVWDKAFNAALLAALLLRKGRLFKHLDANTDL